MAVDPVATPADPAATPAATPSGTIIDATATPPATPAAAAPAVPDPAATPPQAGDPPAAPAPEVDWRTRYSGGDAETLKRLARFSDESAFFKSYRTLEGKLSSGEFKKALPDTATDEEKATWRKENGIPDKAEGYIEKLALPDGLVLGEADKPVISEFAAAALESNIDPKAFNGLVAKYYAIQDAQRIAQEDADAEFKKTSEDALRADWQGVDYRRNLTSIQNMMASWPEGVADRVLAARDPEGRKLGDNPLFIKQLAALAVELNPAATLVPAGTSDPAKSVDAELESIRELRRNDPNSYDANKKLQARELELLEAQMKVKQRAA